MFTKSAEFYDLLYAGIKDYKSEAAQLADMLSRLQPQCVAVLDAACGTGEHARLLAAAGYVAHGLDVNATFVRIAHNKHPAGSFFVADMSNFRLAAPV